MFENVGNTFNFFKMCARSCKAKHRIVVARTAPTACTIQTTIHRLQDPHTPPQTPQRCQEMDWSESDRMWSNLIKSAMALLLSRSTLSSVVYQSLSESITIVVFVWMKGYVPRWIKWLQRAPGFLALSSNFLCVLILAVLFDCRFSVSVDIMKTHWRSIYQKYQSTQSTSNRIVDLMAPSHVSRSWQQT